MYSFVQPSELGKEGTNITITSHKNCINNSCHSTIANIVNVQDVPSVVHKIKTIHLERHFIKMLIISAHRIGIIFLA